MPKNPFLVIKRSTFFTILNISFSYFSSLSSASLFSFERVDDENLSRLSYLDILPFCLSVLAMDVCFLDGMHKTWPHRKYFIRWQNSYTKIFKRCVTNINSKIHVFAHPRTHSDRLMAPHQIYNNKKMTRNCPRIYFVGEISLRALHLSFRFRFSHPEIFMQRQKKT